MEKKNKPFQLKQTSRSRTSDGKAASGSLSPVSDILVRVGESLSLDQKVQEMAVLSLWRQFIPEKFQMTTQAVQILKRGQSQSLLIRVENSVVASELQFYMKEYLAVLNHFSPQTGIKIDHFQLKIGALR